jgi:hypothetical protein
MGFNSDQPIISTKRDYTPSIRVLEVLEIDTDTSECDHQKGQN